ncbi:Zn-ribbon domain-containing OB-fold protein [Rhodococcus sp. T7]|uniref:Zn-ribbon domain-containing OB-fold protein n=1 Tax=Rhodococcus sp. T7 TaxID=627444 RepID=UPI00135C7222|nr:zinc ribbon domain-containing protein [Rhodococcus sp. T7]KAF0965649.1 hypothetical protein MLGJGCBP_01192 [Rhodococcus sp. T7]
MTSVSWGPAPDGLDQPFWDGLDAGEVRIQRCSSCRTWSWGPRTVCGTCHSFDLAWAPVEPAGIVYSWTRSRVPHVAEYTDRVPYVSVLVALPAAGHCRMPGILDDEPDDPRIGDRVSGYVDHEAARPLLRWRRMPGQKSGAA